jgi:hypothetical protein
MVVDHMCENPGCVNPAHLRVTDNRTNVMIGRGACANHARKTHCIRGHRLSGDNLIIHKRGFRQCKVCLRSSQLRWHMRANHGWSGEQMLVLESIAANLWFKAA